MLARYKYDAKSLNTIGQSDKFKNIDLNAENSKETKQE